MCNTHTIEDQAARDLAPAAFCDHNTANGGAFMANGTTDFTKTIDIAAPPDWVWDAMTDVEHWPDWTASVTSIKRLDAGPFAVGSRARIKPPKLLPAIWTVTALIPGRSFTWISGMPGLRVTGHHEVESGMSGSRVTLSIQFEGIFRGVAAAGISQTEREIFEYGGDRSEAPLRNSQILMPRLSTDKLNALKRPDDAISPLQGAKGKILKHVASTPHSYRGDPGVGCGHPHDLLL
jgi:uncharacterized protein YndB with AHSA1/START domain